MKTFCIKKWHSTNPLNWCVCSASWNISKITAQTGTGSSLSAQPHPMSVSSRVVLRPWARLSPRVTSESLILPPLQVSIAFDCGADGLISVVLCGCVRILCCCRGTQMHHYEHRKKTGIIRQISISQMTKHFTCAFFCLFFYRGYHSLVLGNVAEGFSWPGSGVVPTVLFMNRKTSFKKIIPSFLCDSDMLTVPGVEGEWPSRSYSSGVRLSCRIRRDWEEHNPTHTWLRWRWSRSKRAHLTCQSVVLQHSSLLRPNNLIMSVEGPVRQC